MQRESVISMSKSESFKFQIVNKFIGGVITRTEAAGALNKSNRSVSRYACKVRKIGVVGVKHGNFERPSGRRAPQELKDKVIDLIKTQYFDFNVSHIRELLKSKHAINLSYAMLWRWCSEHRLVKAPRVMRRTIRRVRPRMTQEGYCLQMDGCHHRFNGRDEWCLISAIDDATSDIPYAEFFKGETTINCMKVLKRIIELKGVPRMIYTDQAGWAGGLKRENFSQFKRTCEELGIILVFANSPEAKGRVERSYRTIQDRLCPELRLNKITSMQDANTYLHDQFLPNYWRIKCTVQAMDPTKAYSDLNHQIDLDQVLCLEHVRKIAKDQSISWHGTKFEIVSRHNFNLRNYEAVVRVNLNGSTKVFVMGHEVCVRTTIRKPYSDPYAREPDANVSLVYLAAKREQETYNERKDEWIKKIYGSYETYELYCKKKPA